MAPNFARSISFPLAPARSSRPRHVRSVSLPCSSHPLLAHINTHIDAVRSWIKDPTTPASGLAHIHALHAAIANILLLQDPQDVLHRTTNAGERLLDTYLRLADAHQGFQEALLELRQATAESRAALLRGNTARLTSASRTQRRAEKDLAHLAKSISSKCVRLNLVSANAKEAEMAATLMEAANASVAASVAVFLAVASMSSSSVTSSCKKITSMFGSFGKKAASETVEAAIERLHAVERCFQECDGGCDMVFRSIVQTRVSLLNIMTPMI